MTADPVAEARAYIAKTLDNVNGLYIQWENADVIDLLLDVMTLLDGRKLA